MMTWFHRVGNSITGDGGGQEPSQPGRFGSRGARAKLATWGFTLVELLVVISIIALLISLLLPALAKAKADAEQTGCAANLNQIGVAMQEYVDESGYYPGAEAYISPYIGVGCIWIPRLMSMMGGHPANLFYCPADPIEIQAIARTHQQAQLADAIIFVLDGAAIPDKATYTWLEHVIHESADRSCPLILAINKSDEPIGWTGQEIQGPFATISISALMGQGLDVLQAQLAKALDLGDFNAQEAWVFTPRQRKIMARLAEAADVAAAAADLAELLHGPR
jgi:prepilin-type N-terminal cleavage/methylation domain-containing protein